MTSGSAWLSFISLLLAVSSVRMALLAAEGVRIILPWNTEVRRRSESVPGGSRQIRRWPEHQDKKKVLQLHQKQGYQAKRRGHISKQEARRDFLF